MEGLLEDPDTVKINEFATKHDYHTEVYVGKIEDRYYKFSVEFSYNEGVISFDYADHIEGTEVKPYERVVTEWREL